MRGTVDYLFCGFNELFVVGRDKSLFLEYIYDIPEADITYYVMKNAKSRL